jgi:hypothetical protein
MGVYIDPNLPPALKDMIKQQTPYALDAAVPDLSMMYTKSSGFDPGDLAMVDSNAPNMIQFNRKYMYGPDALATKYKQTIPHEYEHVLQNKVADRYPDGYDNEVVKQYRIGSGSMTPKADLVSILRKGGNDQSLYEHLKDRGLTPSPYLGDKNTMGGGMSLREQFADLSALETANHIDLTKDPVVRQRFFNNDQSLIDAYKATTGLRTDRLDSKDLAPMSVNNQVQGPYRATEPRSVSAEAPKSYMQILSDLFK